MPEHAAVGLELARFDARRRLRGAVVLSALISAFALLFLSFFPSMAEIDLEAYVEAMPEIMRELFGIRAMASVEGFLAVEVYQFVWVLLLGLYLAYLGAGTVAGDADADRLDVVLSLPLSRPRVFAEKVASLAPVLVVPNLLVPPAIYAGVLAIGESIDPVALAAVHALSIPYLLACASIGALLSVVVLDGDLARRGAIGAVFALYLLESVSSLADREALGAVSPVRYYDPTAILVENAYDPVDPLVLLAYSGLLLAAGAAWFVRVDAP